MTAEVREDFVDFRVTSSRGVEILFTMVEVNFKSELSRAKLGSKCKGLRQRSSPIRKEPWKAKVHKNQYILQSGGHKSSRLMASFSSLRMVGVIGILTGFDLIETALMCLAPVRT